MPIREAKMIIAIPVGMYYPQTSSSCTTIPTWSTIMNTSIFPTWHNHIIYANEYTNTNSTTCSPTYSDNQLILIPWPVWHEDISIPSIIQERTEAENARIEELRRVELERYEQRKLASDRAKQVLLEHLTPLQREMVEKNGWFVIEGGKSGKRYVIRTNTIAGNIDEMDGNKVVAKYCCHLPHQYPHSDHHLTQKLMLEWDEEAFLRKANRSAVG
jgi:hypothetical protein